jgi:hypothetical protein
MTVSVPARGRLSWPDLPVSTRAAVEAGLGSPVARALRQTPEYGGGIATRLQLADGRWVFAKALPESSPRRAGYQAEAKVAAALPDVPQIPRLLSTVDGGWLVLVFSDIEGTRPKLGPGSPELSAVLTALGALARSLTPCPLPKVADAVDDIGPILHGWRELAADPPRDLDDWAARNLSRLAGLETSWHPWANGNTLLHNDLHPGNLVVAGPGRVQVVNWRYPARGAAWLDLVSLAPHMLDAGLEPGALDRLLSRRPVLADVPDHAVTGFAAALAGHAERGSRLPEPPGTTGLREQQRRLAAVTRRWLTHRTRWR